MILFLLTFKHCNVINIFCILHLAMQIEVYHTVHCNHICGLEIFEDPVSKAVPSIFFDIFLLPMMPAAKNFQCGSVFHCSMLMPPTTN